MGSCLNSLRLCNENQNFTKFHNKIGLATELMQKCTKFSHVQKLVPFFNILRHNIGQIAERIPKKEYLNFKKNKNFNLPTESIF